MNLQPLTVDVREDIRNGQEPFSKIMSAAARLEPGDRLLLIAPFEPVPLFGVLERQGFKHTSKSTDSGDWEVLFTRQSILSETPTNSPALVPTPREPVIEVDARGLEPPQPLVKILEAVAMLADGEQLKARTDRRPMHLYARLEERGFAAETEEQGDGTFLTHIRRK